MPLLHQHPHYKLLRQLGTGGSSVVWQGENMLDGTAVAIKVFPNNSDEARWHCQQEYRKTNQHQHSNILHILEQGEWQGESYLVMPYYAKGSAQDRVGEYSEAECWRICLDIASALQYLHNRKPVVLHNDLKPDNFLCTDRGRYILADLGISLELKKEYLQSLSGQTLEESAAGSGPEAYRAPERFPFRNQEKSIPTIKSEIWSFGACLFQIATGQVPYGERGGFFQLMAREQGTRLRDLRRDFPAHFSEDFKNLVLDCLQYDLMERPSISEIINNAQNALVKLPDDSDAVDTLAQHNSGFVNPKAPRPFFSMSMLIMLAFLFLATAVGYFLFSEDWFRNQENGNVETKVVTPGVIPPKQSIETTPDPDPVPGTTPRDNQSGSIKPGNNNASPNIDKGPGFPLVEFLRDIYEVIKKHPKGSPCETSLSAIKVQMEKCTDISNSKCAQALLCQADPSCGSIAVLQRKYGCNTAIQGNLEFKSNAEKDAEEDVLAMADRLYKRKQTKGIKKEETFYAGVSIGATKTLASARIQKGIEAGTSAVNLKNIILVYNPGSTWKYVLVLEAKNAKAADELYEQYKGRGAQKVTYRRVKHGNDAWWQIAETTKEID